MRLRARVFRAVFVSLLAVCSAGLWTVSPVLAATQEPAASSPRYRIFLKDEQAIPIYGEATTVGDRVVFNLAIARASGAPTLQLVSLPVTAVDLDRTTRYAEAVRAAEYAATRGDDDHAAMSAEVARALAELEKVQDLEQRRALAALARQRLLEWSRAHYAYRAADIQELAGLFDDIARSARVASGETSLSLDLVAGPAVPVREPLRSDPGLRESIELALAAAAASDVPDERLAILRAAAASAGGVSTDLAAVVAGRIDAESASAAAYGALGATLRARAAAARRAGDVATIEQLRAELAERDRQLGHRRADDVAVIGTDLADALERARTYRLALDHYAYVKPALLAYERRVRPVMAVLSRYTVLLEAIREMRSVGFREVEAAATRLKQIEQTVRSFGVPDELAAVHATIASAVEMAREACVRRREAVITNKTQTAREASSAAAGALLLASAVHTDLVTALYPPTPPD